MTDLKTLRHALGGSISNGQLLCPGPGHSRRDRSLAVRPAPNGFVVYSHAGDDWKVCSDYVRERLGLPQWQASDATDYQTRQSVSASNDRERIERAQKIWDEATDPRGTIAEEYLAARKLGLPLELCVTTLRFHPQCLWESGTAPCLIAGFRAIDGDDLNAIHRIRLDQPERWPKAERRMLGCVTDSAIKLDPAGDHLVIGEGLETCMAGRQLGLRPVWALGSAGGMESLAPIDGVKELVILGENDNGRNQKAADTCRDHWEQSRVLLMTPRRGKDFNDYLLEHANDISA